MPSAGRLLRARAGIHRLALIHRFACCVKTRGQSRQKARNLFYTAVHACTCSCLTSCLLYRTFNHQSDVVLLTFMRVHS